MYDQILNYWYIGNFVICGLYVTYMPILFTIYFCRFFLIVLTNSCPLDCPGSYNSVSPAAAELSMPYA